MTNEQTIDQVTNNNVTDAKGTNTNEQSTKQPESKKGKGKGQKLNVKSSVMTVIIKTVSDITGNHVFDLAHFTKSLGQCLNGFPEKFTVTMFGGKITVPGITAKTDNRDRALSFLKELVKTIFAGMEIDAVLPASETNKHLVLASLKETGFKFSTYNKLEVAKAVELWAKNRRARKLVSERVVIGLNAKLISETSVLLKYAKDLHANNTAAIAGFEVATRKTLGLPEPKKEISGK